MTHLDEVGHAPVCRRLQRAGGQLRGVIAVARLERLFLALG